MKYTVKHRYKRWQIIKIIKRHLYLKKPIQEYIDYIGKEYDEKIYKAQMDTLLYGSSKFTL